uniref:Cell division cycle and apoptosis regulator protein 1-like isoform X1 n=1 Tax=Tanacetum cinerariifolium TaxID=118510 RepID=A0A6L2LY80_TANCI|nr:cell division cycle and apoptosis regulator protein 1-like isoform X1 [Tanacetum cinerariifolium]
MVVCRLLKKTLLINMVVCLLLKKTLMKDSKENPIDKHGCMQASKENPIDKHGRMQASKENPIDNLHNLIHEHMGNRGAFIRFEAPTTMDPKIVTFSAVLQVPKELDHLAWKVEVVMVQRFKIHKIRRWGLPYSCPKANIYDRLDAATALRQELLHTQSLQPLSAGEFKQKISCRQADYRERRRERERILDRREKERGKRERTPPRVSRDRGSSVSVKAGRSSSLESPRVINRLKNNNENMTARLLKKTLLINMVVCLLLKKTLMKDSKENPIDKHGCMQASKENPIDKHGRMQASKENPIDNLHNLIHEHMGNRGAFIRFEAPTTMDPKIVTFSAVLQVPKELDHLAWKVEVVMVQRFKIHKIRRWGLPYSCPKANIYDRLDAATALRQELLHTQSLQPLSAGEFKEGTGKNLGSAGERKRQAGTNSTESIKGPRLFSICKGWEVYSFNLMDVERDYLSMDRRYTRLYVSPECAKVVVNWSREDLNIPLKTPYQLLLFKNEEDVVIANLDAENAKDLAEKRLNGLNTLEGSKNMFHVRHLSS